ncbi:ribonucleotide-diphosphate reductase, partial [Staphylococcus sp. SIMBA_130]
MRKEMITTSVRGLNEDSLPFRLYQKAKKFGGWDPREIDFTQDVKDWQFLTGDQQEEILRLVSQFQAGEEAVTLDLLPLIMVIAKEGRLEEEMYLTTFL